MIIETKRLNVVALNPKQLELWTKDIARLEKEIGCTYVAEPIVGIFKDIICGQVEKAKNDAENYLWHTFWFIIRKEDNNVVGSIDFKNTPFLTGEVEIGYGLGKDYEHQGYMTEAVEAFCYWGLKQSSVNHIIAETEIDNIASQNILKRCGFVEYLRNETVWWRL